MMMAATALQSTTPLASKFRSTSGIGEMAELDDCLNLNNGMSEKRASMDHEDG